MQVIELSKEQVCHVYQESMVVDFPEAERKPLAMILKSMDGGAYECLGLSENHTIIAYAFFYRNQNDYLFDYFATFREYRNRGIGERFLSYILQYFQEKQADSVIGEVEDSAYAKSDEEARIQNRRLNFYLRNGYVDSEVRSRLFGVNYKVLELVLPGVDSPHTRTFVEEIYRKHYRTMLPRDKFESMVCVKNVC